MHETTFSHTPSGASPALPVTPFRVPLPDKLSSARGEEWNLRIIALCAEPGMGKGLAVADAVSRASERGMRVFRRSYRGTPADTAVAHIVKTARTVLRLTAPPLVALEDVPPFDESCVRRAARAIRRMAQCGAVVVVSLSPEAAQLLDSLPECSLVGSEALLVRPIALARASEPAYELRRLTRGIPLLVRGLRTASLGPSGGLEIPSSYYEALSLLVESSLRMTLTDEELRLRLSMLLLGEGSVDDLRRVAGGASEELLSSIALNAPLYGVSELLDSFACVQAETLVLPSSAYLPIRSLCALFPEVASNALRLLVSRGDCSQAAIVFRMPGACDEIDALLSAGTQFIDAGEASLVGEALRRMSPLHRVRSEDCRALEAAYACVTERHLPLGADITPQFVDSMAAFESALIVEARRALREPLEPLDRSLESRSPLARRLEAHREAWRLVVEGRPLAAMQLLVSSYAGEDSPSVSGLLLRADLELVRVLLLDFRPGTDPGASEDMGLLASSDYEGLRLVSSLFELLRGIADFDERVAPIAETLSVRAERSGDAILEILALLVGSVCDIRSGAYAHAGVRTGMAVDASRSLGATYLMRVSLLFRFVVEYLMGERRAFPSVIVREHDDLGRVATLLMRAMGAEPDERVVVTELREGVPRNALWVLLALSDGLGALSSAIREETPVAWSRALAHARQGWRQKVALREGGADAAEGGAFALVRAGEVVARATPIELTLLGGFSVRVRGRRIEDWKLDQRNAHSMLEYLALRKGASARRYQIVEQVWPESDYASGFNKVYQATSVIRSAVGEVDKGLNPFVTKRSSHEVALNRELVSCDVDVFRVCARDASDSDDDEATLRMARCVEKIYVGDLCLPATDATGYVAAVRDELRGLYVDAMVAGSEAALRLGQGRTATRMAKNATFVDEMREDAIIALVCALRSTGRDAEADRQYRRYAQRLARDGKGAPSRRLREALGEG